MRTTRTGPIPVTPEYMYGGRPAPDMTSNLDRLAWLMDRAIPIPGTKIRVGLDALLGLIPVGGDALTGIIQVGLVLVAMAHYKVPKAVAARMAANVLLDVGVGAIPLLGDVFDVFFKANTRNMALLKDIETKQKLNQPISTTSSKLYLIGIAAILLLAVALVVIGFITVVAWLLKRPLI